MRIVITGATGLIGKALCQRLSSNYEIIALSRNPEQAQSILGPDLKVVQWDTSPLGEWGRHIDGAFGIINLAGEPIASGRWTQARKQRILQSRLNATKAIVDAIVSAKNKPGVLIQASAIGYYGFDRQESLDESTGAGSGFLADVCKQWEFQTKPVEQAGTRCVIIRTGLVLSRSGGALSHLMMPFHFFLGGYPGTGRQQVSWITIDDETAAIEFLIENPQLSGPFNLTAPNPVTMKELCKTIGRIMHRPCRLPIPALALRIIFGKMAYEILLSGQRVIPNRLLKTGFTFTHPSITEALQYLLGKGKK